MKKHSARIFACALVASLLAAPAVKAAPQNFELDQQHFSIVFSVSHMNMSYTYGMFRQAQARVALDRENPSATQFQMSINADSIDTNNAARDKHLKGPDFFDVAQYPAITFESTRVVLDNRPQQGIVYQVTGNLTMHGVTQQVTLPVQLLGQGPGPGGQGQHAGFLTQTELKRSEFGVGGGRFADTNMLGDAIGITVSFEAIREDGAAPPPR
jgi:polyisoprenoid-binding protein YceI